jgi:hypothetical protein
VKSADQAAYVASCIANGTCQAVSDASLKFPIGTSAFIIAGPFNTHKVRGVNTVPGPLKDGDSFRCELAGLFGCITLLHCICQLHQVPNGHVEIACDNISTIDVFQPWYLPDPTRESFDLVNSLWYLIQSSPITFHAVHVKGHQDTLSSAPLTRLQSLNVEADALAVTYRNLLLEANPNCTTAHVHIAHEGFSVWNGSSKIASPNKCNLYREIYRPRVLRRWNKPSPLSPPRFLPVANDQIDWTQVNRFMSSLPAARRRWCTKHGSENCGVGLTLLHWEKQSDAECPRCSAPENTTHVLRCPNAAATTTWQHQLNALSKTLTDLQTPLELATAMILRLQSWRLNLPLLLDPTWDETTSLVISSQDQIGWKNFMEGLPSKFWIPVITNHYLHHHIRTSPHTWLQTCLQALHSLAWHMWDHRNQVLHDTAKPRQQKALQLLHQQILTIYSSGSDQVHPTDRSHFSLSLYSLLQKPLHYKQAWLLNVSAAIARYQEDLEALADAQSNSPLIHWIRTGRLK